MPSVTEPRSRGDAPSSDLTLPRKASRGLRFYRKDDALAALVWRARRWEGD